MAAKITQAEAVQRIRDALGDHYDLSRVAYVDSKTKITVMCVKHGAFHKLPHLLWKGAGCHVCHFKNRVDIDQVLNRFRSAHGDKYDYSRVNYTHHAKSVSIICPNHGMFLKTPVSHWNGSGCSDCAKENSPSHLITTEKSILKFITVHGDKYDYSLVDYKKSNIPVEIVCPHHGVFNQTPALHLAGSGCSRCTTQISKPESQWADVIEKSTGLNVQRNKKIEGVRGRVDMCIEDDLFGKLAIEYDGCYWHNSETSIENDKRKTLLLTDLGYRVVRLREIGSHTLGSIDNAFLNIWVKPEPSNEQVSQVMHRIRIALVENPYQRTDQ